MRFGGWVFRVGDPVQKNKMLPLPFDLSKLLTDQKIVGNKYPRAQNERHIGKGRMKYWSKQRHLYYNWKRWIDRSTQPAVVKSPAEWRKLQLKYATKAH